MVRPHSIPLHGLRTSRYRGDVAFCRPSGRLGIAPNISPSVINYLSPIPHIAMVSGERVAPFHYYSRATSSREISKRPGVDIFHEVRAMASKQIAHVHYLLVPGETYREDMAPLSRLA